MRNFVDLLMEDCNNTSLFFLGQAGFIIKSKNGKLLTIDPYLSNCVERVEGHVGFKRLLPIILEPNDIIFDYIVTTHFHKDHFDDDSIPVMMNNKTTKLFSALDCKNDLNKFNVNLEQVEFVKPGDMFYLEDFELFFINCDHGKGAPEAVGVIVKVDNKNIVIIGDSCLREDWVHEYMSCGSVDILIAPINGKYGNLNSSECARLSGLLDAKITIPCHVGMFASHGGNLEEFINIMNNNYPKNKYVIMSMGEKIIL